MEKEAWILQELQRIYDNTSNYNVRTLMKAAQDIIEEQRKRIDQMEGEMEGTIWSPRRWGE
ncbi:hypothetical protein SAMN05877753_10959 [Bacillus oleivorans]|uniref:Uncharacterized protein n=1 Tax=Bacillus oleivorans TaxID=1448271 RepID=A0A285D4W9_9BACI|nr:hypothetical protein [Bacillus oleivorans]SNX74358.1 hypothetical protein SAMN05877753_10959 [Bacillus oleivorans]